MSWTTESSTASSVYCDGGRLRKRFTASSAASESGCSSASGKSMVSRAPSFSSIAEGQESVVADQLDEGVEEYAIALRPLLVTRAELVKQLARMPREVLMSPPRGEESAPADHVAFRELLGALCGSIACVARVGDSARTLCLGVGVDYAAEEYSLNPHVRTRLVIAARVLQGVLPCGAAGGLPSVQLRVTDVTSREPFIAELLAMDGALRAGMDDRLFGPKGLKQRRRTLRHVADAMRALRNKRSTQGGARAAGKP